MDIRMDFCSHGSEGSIRFGMSISPMVKMKSSIFEFVVRKSTFCSSCKLSMVSMNYEAEVFGESWCFYSILLKSPTWRFHQVQIGIKAQEFLYYLSHIVCTDSLKVEGKNSKKVFLMTFDVTYKHIIHVKFEKQDELWIWVGMIECK